MIEAALRRYQAADRPSLYAICLRTGDRGRDASATSCHPELLGDYYAIPYVEREPDLCLVLTSASGPQGYILGTADTRSFVAWFNREWLPGLRMKFASVSASAGASDAWLRRHLERDAELPPCADDYPAHLHIDLLPAAQAQGWGRRMVAAWFELLRARGVPGVHLGVSKANHPAIAFYARVGFERLGEQGGAWLYGARLDP
jgi:ribosomal protein S18 acetylase RimI-like enzyme